MNIVMGGRRSGKTTILARWMADAPPGTTRVCVAPNQAMANLVRARATELGLNLRGWKFVSVDSLDRLRGKVNLELGVDQIDHCDEELIKASTFPIGLVTMTYESSNGNQKTG